MIRVWKKKRRKSTILLCGMLLISSLFLFTNQVQAQIEPPSRKFLFLEDQAKKERLKEKKRSPVTKPKEKSEAVRQKLPFDIDSPSLQFDTKLNMAYAEGGLVITQDDAVLEADRASLDLNTYDVDLRGNVWLSDPSASISADGARLNLKSKEGSLDNARIDFNQGGYIASAKKVQKDSGETLYLEDPTLTTCHCEEPDVSSPWRLDASRGKVTREGYGEIWNGTLNIHD